MVLARHDRGVGLLPFERQDWTTCFEVEKVERHQHAHADSFKQINYVHGHLHEEERPVHVVPASFVLIDNEAANVRQGEKGGDNRVGASLFP